MKIRIGGMALLALFQVVAASGAVSRIDLSGTWNVRLDPQDQGEAQRWFNAMQDTREIKLPGIVTEIGLGEPLALKPEMNKTVMRHLHQKFRYIGPAWYEREITVPADWAVRPVTLSFERSIMETSVWVNGSPAGKADSLTVPHRFEVGNLLKPGVNRLVVRVDNRDRIGVGWGHAYTDETQTIWNGLIGRMELVAEDNLRITEFKVSPRPVNGKVPVQVVVGNSSKKAWRGEAVLQAIPVDRKTAPLPEMKNQVEVGAAGATLSLDYPVAAAEKWSEFNPALYRVQIRLGDQEKSLVTGFRTVEADGKRLLVNGNPSFMRGTLENCQFPKTGYPPTDEAAWERVFRIARDYGLNHMRFHSWCPPEAAFAAADRLGFYLQVELPTWTNSFGEKPRAAEYFKAEGERMFKEYAHHPSFTFLSLGNELKGNFDFMDNLVRHFRTLVPHILFTSTTFSFSPRGGQPGPADDYFITQQSKSGWVRGQGFINQTKPTTDSDYSQGVASLDIPLITHEVGQYHVYPNLAELPKFDGNLRALNFEAIREDLLRKGRLNEAADYTQHSGKLAVLLYKEDLERAMRTVGQSGIQLLDMHDFLGQSTATVGILDSFWDSKGLIPPEAFRSFCCPVVPLVRMPKMTWQNNETFAAAVEVANFGAAAMKGSSIRCSLADESGKVLFEQTLDPVDLPLGNGNRVGDIRFPLAGINKAACLTLSVEIAGTPYANSWHVWVYPAAEQVAEGEVTVVREYGPALFKALEEGRKVLFLCASEMIKNPIDGRFIPVFWSPLHFDDQPGTLGAWIDPAHPVFADFPTSADTDWQWWELLSTSVAVDMDPLSVKPSMPMRFVDKFSRNAQPAGLFEARVGKGRLLACSLDIESKPHERIVARQLRGSILQYMNSNEFNPATVFDKTILDQLFCGIVNTEAFRANEASASSAHQNHPARLASDGNPDTHWHNNWVGQDQRFPFELTIDLKGSQLLGGFIYVPRQNMNRGRVKDYRIEVSQDGKNWKAWGEAGSFEDGKRTRQVMFAQPIRARYLRMVILSGQVANEPIAAVAEFGPVIKSGGVEDLGIVPGFNDK